MNNQGEYDSLFFLIYVMSMCWTSWSITRTEHFYIDRVRILELIDIYGDRFKCTTTYKLMKALFESGISFGRLNNGVFTTLNKQAFETDNARAICLHYVAIPSKSYLPFICMNTLTVVFLLEPTYCIFELFLVGCLVVGYAAECSHRRHLLTRLFF